MSQPPTASQPLSPEDQTLALEELRKILDSTSFSRSRRHSDLLSYLVRLTLAGHEHKISEYSIAWDVYNKEKTFNPEIDAAMRVEVRRLRARLESYYATESNGASIQISLPSGYVPRFNRPASAEPFIALPLIEPQPSSVDSNSNGLLISERASAYNSRHFRLWIAMALAAAAIVSGALFLITNTSYFRNEARSYQVTSYPGTQRDPTLSPQEDRVAFDWVGDSGDNHDIYVKSLRGNDLLRLTSDPAIDHGPAWSPDGQTIAFLRRLPGLRQAVYLVPSRGGTEKKIGEIGTLIAGICWTRDSRWLIVSDAPQGSRLALFLMSVSTGERRQLTGYIGAYHPSVSPDGRTLVFVRDDGGQPALALQRLSAEYTPSGSPESTNARGTLIMFPRWARDGASIYYASLDNGIWRAYNYQLNTRKTQSLPEIGTGATTIEQMRDRRSFLVTRGQNHSVIVQFPLQLKDSQAQPYFYSSWEDEDPSISPDSHKLAFVSTRSGAASLWISEEKGEHPRQITLPGVLPEHPQWSPDSSTVVFAGRTKGQCQVYRVSASSAKVDRLILDGADDCYPSYSRDGRWIYFISNVAGFSQVWKAPARGGYPVLVSANPASFAEESVDRKNLIYSWGSDLYSLSFSDGRVLRLSDRQDIENYRYFHVSQSGVYCFRNGSSRSHRIEFQSFSGTPPSLIFSSPYAIHGFSLTPDNSSLLIGLQKGESHIEVELSRD